MHYYRYPQFNKKNYTYTLSNIIFLGETLGNIIKITMAHLYTYSCMDIILFLKIYYNPFFSANVTVLFADVSSFLPMLLLKIFHFLQVNFFLS